MMYRPVTDVIIMKQAITIKNRWVQRIRKLLEELLENIPNLLQPPRRPVPVRVPVNQRSQKGFEGHLPNMRYPVRLCSCRYYATMGATSGCQMNPFRFIETIARLKWKTLMVANLKWLHLELQRFTMMQNMMSSKIFPHFSFLYCNFSQKFQSQFRNQLVNSSFSKTNLVSPVKSLNLALKALTNERHLPLSEEQEIHTQRIWWKTPANAPVKSGIRLNSSLTPQYASETITLAKGFGSSGHVMEQSCGGAYVDFPVDLKISIPESTILNEETLGEIILSLQMLERRIAEVKKDLINLFQLGELPISFLYGQNILRVHFPNCDKDQLEALLLEKNIQNGTVKESFGSEGNNEKYDSVLSDFDAFNSNLGSSSLISSSYSLTEEDFSRSHVWSHNDIVMVEPLSLEGLADHEMVFA